MKLNAGYIEVKDNKIMRFFARLMGVKGKPVRGFAFFPFIFLLDSIDSRIFEYILNHEKIHLAQQKETLIIGHHILSLIELIYYRLFKKVNSRDFYYLQVSEQEAYDNMYDLGYLNRRKHYAQFRYYLKNKPVTEESTKKAENQKLI